MNYEEFKSIICELIREALPEHLRDSNIEIVQNEKNNGVWLDAVSIQRQDTQVIPQMYLDGYFQDLRNGRTMESIVDDMVQIYLSKDRTDFRGFPFDVTDYNEVKTRLTVQLINGISNEDFLKDVPCKSLDSTDLVAVYRVELESTEQGTSSAQVKNSMLELWGISADTLHQDAINNAMEKEPAKLVKMTAVMSSVMFGLDVRDIPITDFEMEPGEMYVLSNSNMLRGASALMYPGLMKTIAENSDTNVFILPSSIHETILLRDTGEMNAEELKAMVAGINQSEVSPEEVLSNEVYYFDRKEQTISMATSRENTAELMERLKGTEHDYKMDGDEFQER